MKRYFYFAKRDPSVEPFIYFELVQKYASTPEEIEKLEDFYYWPDNYNP